MGIIFRKKQNEITFSVREGFEFFEKIDKANKFLPEWFKKIKPFETPTGKLQGHRISGFLDAITVKKCVPVLDAMSLGYIIPLWADMMVYVDHEVELYNVVGEKINLGGIVIINNSKLLSGFFNAKIEKHTDLVGMEIEGIKIGGVSLGKLNIVANFNSELAKTTQGKEIVSGQISGHHPDQFGGGFDLYPLGTEVLKLNSPWVIKVPKGYSVYFKNPANHHANNINIFEGLVDHDKYPLNVNFPFMWTGGERGVFLIKKGTPLAQIIPIKRETFKEKFDVISNKKIESLETYLRSFLHDAYKKVWWHKRK